VLGYGLDDQGFESRQGLGIFLFTTVSRLALGPTQTPNQWLPGALSLGVKLPGREADHSPPSTAEIKNSWSYTTTPQHTFMLWSSVKTQGHLYLLSFHAANTANEYFCLLIKSSVKLNIHFKVQFIF
jgi:hypothetical protein